MPKFRFFYVINKEEDWIDLEYPSGTGLDEVSTAVGKSAYGYGFIVVNGSGFSVPARSVTMIRKVAE